MIAGTVVFFGVVSLLAWGAAWTADQGLRRLGLPTRGVWLVGLVAPFALLVLPLLVPSGAPLPGAGGAPSTPFELAPIDVGDGVAGLGFWISVALGTVWALSSVGLVVSLVRSHLRLTRERHGWPTSEVSGRSVYVSTDRGPAVAGVWKPWIVLPRWALKLPSQELQFVLLHEEEHIRARDTTLLAGALALVALTPWSPGAWLTLRGLKLAMEVDCDRRVLRRAPDRATYGDSLLTVAARSSGLSLGLAAFTEKERSLKTRILAMTSRATRWTAVRSLLFLAVATLVGLQACYVESPILIIGDDDEVAEAVRELIESRDAQVSPSAESPPAETTEPAGAGEQPDEAEPSSSVIPPEPPAVREPAARVTPPSEPREVTPEPDVRERTTEELGQEPTFTPFTVAPSIRNRSEVVAAMNAEYPPLLREAGIGGTVRVYFFIDEGGRVQDYRIDVSSGHQALDDAALRVADVFRFSPALNRDDPVPVWVQFPITFQAGGGR